jgi:hypothetical protein
MVTPPESKRRKKVYSRHRQPTSFDVLMGKRMRTKTKRPSGPSKGNAKKSVIARIEFANTLGEIPEAVREETPEPTQKTTDGQVIFRGE